MENLVIYGAGEAGKQIYNEIKEKDSFNVVALIDDSPKKIKIKDSGLPIYHSDEIESLIREKQVDYIYLAIPSLDSLAHSRILNKLFELGVAVKSLPKKFSLYSDLVNENMMSVPSIENILGRRDFNLNPAFLDNVISDREILVTGGGGSIGSELVRQLVNYGARRITVIDSNEYNLYK